MPSHSELPNRRDASRSGSGESVASSRDDALMARVAGGDARAFEELVNGRITRVLAVSRRVLGNDAEAEDVAQEAFLRLWRQADKWEPGRARVGTWLYRVAVNLSIDRLRRRTETSDENVPEPVEQGDQHRSLEEQDLRDEMDAALQALPERQRMALVLFHYEGLAMSEAAELMEISVEALESLLARARRTLKRQLADTWRALLPEGGE